jgi:hypothetical protein
MTRDITVRDDARHDKFGNRLRCTANLVATIASPLMDAMYLRSRRNEEGDVVEPGAMS